MANNTTILRKIPIMIFIVLLSGLALTFNSVRAQDNGKGERIVHNWTANGYKEVTVKLSDLTLGTSSLGSDQSLDASSAGCVLSPTGMISHWPLDGTFEDVSGGHDGTCDDTSCPLATTGKVGGAFGFNSSDGDSINVPSSTDFDWLNTDNFSVGVWVKTTQNCTGNKVFIGRYRETVPNGTWWVGCAPVDSEDPENEDGVAVFRLRDSNLNPRQANGTTKINDGQWHYIVGVRDGVNDKNYLYVDGVMEKMLDIPVYTGQFASDLRLTMGSYDDPQDYYYEGVMDEVVIYDRALPANEIESYFNACIVLSPDIYLPLVLR
ncbi:LamG domain-containing protein [Chloroflexota bacterium]